MRKFLGALLPALLVTLATQAQTNFRPGYVLPTEGDTLRGQLDFRGERRNSRLCRFRPAEGGAVTDYRPEQLRGYGVAGGAQYQTISVKVLRQISATETDSLPQTLFAEALVLGPASLLYLHDPGDAARFFLRMGQQPAQELLQRSEDVRVNGQTLRRKTDEFRRTLAASMKDCYAVQPELTQVQLTHNSLIKVVRLYNECVGAKPVVPVSAERRNRARLALVAGGQRRTLTYRPDESVLATFPINKALSVDGKVEPVLGLALQLSLAGLNRHLSGRVEALYESQAFSHQRSSPGGFSGTTVTREIRTRLTQLQVPVFVRYAPAKGLVRPFAQVGFMGSYFLRADCEIRTKTTPATEYSAWEPLLEPRRYEFGYGGSLGLSTARPEARNLSLELRYLRSNGFSDNIALETSQSRWALLLSYELTK
ncbi:PorT family protein [Hymenobacter gummosus]|uniref:PorT family protein n=1 Tax=Hymenobacter gummosus TaxID=1776032 RepID=A0A431U3G7_9BACT|nr:PorT family protein [Hymenobacter gummosus]RTQ50153.1 PorT family protein [Hymenobacter gummosus]